MTRRLLMLKAAAMLLISPFLGERKQAKTAVAFERRAGNLGALAGLNGAVTRINEACSLALRHQKVVRARVRRLPIQHLIASVVLDEDYRVGGEWVHYQSMFLVGLDNLPESEELLRAKIQEAIFETLPGRTRIDLDAPLQALPVGATVFFV